MAETKKIGSINKTPYSRHGHLVTPGQAEGTREDVDQALQNMNIRQKMVDRQRSGREMRIGPKTARQGKKAA